MKKTLHVLNGDCAKAIFSQTSIQGDVIVWRALLCDGPLDKVVASNAFWKKRLGFFSQHKICSSDHYQKNVIEEVGRLKLLDNYDEVVLWFEYDLFCQVNMLAVCSMIYNVGTTVSCSLICAGRIENQSKLKGLGELTWEAFEKLFSARKVLEEKDLLFAQSCWERYVLGDKKDLETFDYSSNTSFNYLKEAMHQHVLRMPDDHGISSIDIRILSFIKEGHATFNLLVNALLNWQGEETVYGFGDLQYKIYINDLQDYYEFKNETFVLNDKGQELLYEYGL